MSQGIFSSINPNTTSGTQLATILDDFKDAVVSGFSGTSRPPNLNANGYWVDTTNAGSGLYAYTFYDGTNDIVMFTINSNTNTVTFPGISDSFEIIKTSDDSIGPVINLQKKRLSGGGQTLADDIIGDIDFLGNDSSAVTYVQGRIRTVSTDDVSASEQGCYMAFSATPTDGSALVEVLRLTGDRRVGIGGVDAPVKTIDTTATDDSAGIQTAIVEDSANAAEVIIQKKRATGLGQVLSGDNIGVHLFKSVDQLGALTEVAKATVVALQDHTNSAQGVSYTISVKDEDTTAFIEAFKIQNGDVFAYGEKLAGAQPSEDLLAGTNAIATVDSTKYKAFKLTAYIHGSGTEERQQEVIVKGIYDTNNTTWVTRIENDVLGGSDKAITIAIVDAATITVNYTNNIPSFASGKIYKKLQRYPS